MKNVYAVVFVTVLMAGLSGHVYAGGSVQHFSNAVDHSAKAVFHATAGAGKLVSGAVAVPLIVSGEVGKVSGEIGTHLWDEANTTLPITDDVITVGPSPAEAIRNEEKP